MNILRMLLKKSTATIPESNSLVTFLNPYSYILARKNKEIYNNFDVIYADGIMLVVFLRFIGVDVKRLSFDMTSLAPIVFEKCVEKKLNIALVGSTQDNVQAAVDFFKQNFGKDLNFVYVRNGFFSSKNDLHLAAKEIVEIAPDVVISGMGAIKQEEFLLVLKDLGWRGIGYTCGGFIHQTASKGIKYYPRFFDALNIRWFYRIIDEPKLIKRYLFFYPVFIALFIWDFAMIKKNEK
jgi:N-acetylglucosaminyldiphosphoundecaprenol N-acetyl-beta-D-mannosaminyltransferase